MAKVVAIANQKGGVGKTTTCVNLSSCVAALGKRVLVVDLDPQGNTTSGYGVAKHELDSDVYTCLIDDEDVRQAIVKTQYNADLLPSNTQLAGASLDLLTVNGLCACDTVLIPIQCEYYALEGLSELMNTLKTVRKKYNRYLDIEGVVFTMYAGRLNLTMQVVAQVKKYYGNKVYKSVIPRTVRLSEAPSYGMPINFYEPNGKGSEAYMSLAREFLAANERE